MEKINTLFLNNIQDFIVFAVKMLNYYVYVMELPIIILGCIIALILIYKKHNNYCYKYEISKCLKISFFMIVVGYLIKYLNINVIVYIFNIVFSNLMVITLLSILIMYILDRNIFYNQTEKKRKTSIKDLLLEKISLITDFILFESNSVIKLNMRYLDNIITVTYTFLLISSMYGIKNIILPCIWQIALISIKFSIENEKSVNETKSCTLYETRRKQLDILKDMIKNSDYKNYAIAINGEWGSGKSELIETLVKECRDDNYYIYIKPMVSDTQEILSRELQKSISKFMKDEGIYSGKNSSLDKYFKEILKLMQFNNKITLSDFIDLANSDDSYKNLKKDLQNDIDMLLNTNTPNPKNKRLVVIIDDFDRVHQDKQLEILSFIKEIIDFNGCVTIIALDYENLKDNKFVNPLYLEKFIATQIPLVNVKFDEIIKFHVNDILKQEFLRNSFSKKILQEISDNICNYYTNIEIRIQNYCIKKDEEISKITDKNKNDAEIEMNKFNVFYHDRIKNTNNSRRIIHFLKEIQNTLILVDQLYTERNEGESFLNTIKASEIIYFFNYIKVFYNQAYEAIVKLNGIKEYIDDLDIRDNKLEKSYFEVILGDIIPQKDSTFGFFSDEVKQLKEINSLNLIKDLFIDYYFIKNKIEVLTNSEKYLIEIDNNKICINDNYLKNIQIYQNAIYSDIIDEHKTTTRTICLVNYIVELYNQNKIDFVSILELTNCKSNYGNIIYAKYYLKEASRLVKEGKVYIINENEKNRIISILKELEINNIIKYRYILVELMIIATLGKNKDEDIKKLIGNVDKTDQLFEEIKKYSIKNDLIKNEDRVINFRELKILLLEKIKNSNYTIIDFKLLDKRLDEFLLNYEYINNIKKFQVNIDMNDIYNEPSEYLIIKDINHAKKILNDLNQKQQIDSYKVEYFQKTIKFLLQEKIVDDECISYAISIFKKIKKENCWSEYGWFDITVNVEKLRVLGEDKEKNDKLD